ADLGRALDELRHLLELDPVRGDVVEEEERLGAAGQHVVDAVSRKVGAAVAKRSTRAREDQLRADGVRGGGQEPCLVEGAAEVCRVAGVALVGGETAELPGIYRGGELDFAGTCVGIVDRDRMIDGSRIDAGDSIVGLPSAGLHANGFTLVRRILELEDYDGEDLLAPTCLYLDDVRQLRERGEIRGLAHITGGGILGNLARILPEGLAAELDWSSWERPPVFGWLARHVEEDELRRVFNLGIGYIAVVSDPGDALVIGTIVRV
ncbi:MAG: AIR synthase-related protein, partial [Actinomycetota bacterium]|nr:AIR synthase-related protein [Actinomycetota bacterium]